MNFREKIIIYAAALIVVIFASVIFFIYPLTSKIVEVKDQIDEQKIALEIIKNKSENISTQQKDYELVLQKKEVIEKMTLSSANQVNFFKDIEGLAQRNNLTQNYTLDSPNTENVSEININIQLNGEYLNILSYLKDLESLDYYVKIFSLKYAVSTTAQPVNATLQAKTYWQ
ncbi:MAG: hypothetical protein WC528_02220 [Patescibacteria group bacterium]